MRTRTIPAALTAGAALIALAGCASGTASSDATAPPAPTSGASRQATRSPTGSASPTAETLTNAAPAPPELPAPWTRLPGTKTPTLTWTGTDNRIAGTATVWTAPANRRTDACAALTATMTTWAAANPTDTSKDRDDQPDGFDTATTDPAALTAACTDPDQAHTFGAGTQAGATVDDYSAVDAARTATTGQIIAVSTWTDGRLATTAALGGPRASYSTYDTTGTVGDLTAVLFSVSTPAAAQAATPTASPSASGKTSPRATPSAGPSTD